MTTTYKNFRKVRILNEISSYGDIITEKRDNNLYITTFTATSYTTFDIKHLNTVFVGPLFTHISCYDKYLNRLVVCTDNNICVCDRGSVESSVGYGDLCVQCVRMVVCFEECAVILTDKSEVITVGYDLSIRNRIVMEGAYLVRRVGVRNKLVVVCRDRIVLYRIDSGQEVCVYNVQHKITSMFVSGYTSLIGTKTGLVALLCLKTGEFIHVVQFDVPIWDVSANLTDGLVGVCDVRRVLHVYDLRNGVVVDRMVDVCRVAYLDGYWVVTRINNGKYRKGCVEGNNQVISTDRDPGTEVHGQAVAKNRNSVTEIANKADEKTFPVNGEKGRIRKEYIENDHQSSSRDIMEDLKARNISITGTCSDESRVMAEIRRSTDLSKIDLELYRLENYKLTLKKCRRTFGEKIIGIGNYTRRNLVLIGDRSAFNLGYFRDEQSFKFKMLNMTSGWTAKNKIRYYDIKDRIVVGTEFSISELDHTNKREVSVFKTYNERIACMALSECSNFVIFSLGSVAICMNLKSALIYKRICLENVVGVAMTLLRDRILLYDDKSVHFYRINGQKLSEMVVDGINFMKMMLIENMLVMIYAKQVVLIDIDRHSVVNEIIFKNEIKDVTVSNDFRKLGVVFENYAAVYELGSNTLIDTFTGEHDKILFSLHNEFVVLTNYSTVELYADENWFYNNREVNEVFESTTNHSTGVDNELIAEKKNELMVELLSYLEFERRKN